MSCHLCPCFHIEDSGQSFTLNTSSLMPQSCSHNHSHVQPGACRVGGEASLQLHGLGSSADEWVVGGGGVMFYSQTINFSSLARHQVSSPAIDLMVEDVM